MKKHVKAYTLYTRGLGEGSLSMLASCYGAEAEMLDLEKGFPRQEKNKHSRVIWITMNAWVDLTSDERSKISDLPKILVLPSDAEISHLNDFGSLGFTAILVEPLQGQKVREAMTNALETSNIQQDIHRSECLGGGVMPHGFVDRWGEIRLPIHQRLAGRSADASERIRA